MSYMDHGHIEHQDVIGKHQICPFIHISEFSRYSYDVWTSNCLYWMKETVYMLFMKKSSVRGLIRIFISFFKKKQVLILKRWCINPLGCLQNVTKALYRDRRSKINGVLMKVGGPSTTFSLAHLCSYFLSSKRAA